MDENEPVVDRNLNLTHSWSNAQPGTNVSIPADEDQHSNTSKSVDIDSCSEGGSNSSSVEDVNSGPETYSASSDEEDTELSVSNDLKTTSQDNLNRVSDADTYLEDLMMIFGSKCTITKWKETDVSEIYSSAFIMLHPEESVIQNSQQSSSDGGQSSQFLSFFCFVLFCFVLFCFFSMDFHILRAQIPVEEPALESQSEVSAADEAHNSMPATDLFYISELGTEAIVFDFKSRKPPSTRNMDHGIENFPEPSLVSEATTCHKYDESCNNLSATGQVHSVHGHSLESQNVANLEDKSSGSFLIDSQGHFDDGKASFSSLEPASVLVIYSEVYVICWEHFSWIR